MREAFLLQRRIASEARLVDFVEGAVPGSLACRFCGTCSTSIDVLVGVVLGQKFRSKVSGRGIFPQTVYCEGF